MVLPLRCQWEHHCCDLLWMHKKDERSENFHTMNERVARELIRAFQHPKLHTPDQHHNPVDENITRAKKWTHPGVVPTSPFRSTSSNSKDRSKVNRIALIVAKAKPTPLKESESLCQPNSRHFRSAPCQHARGPIPKVVTFP